jgi:putative spermidine/putrescine transport system substrate-binding protein
VGAPNPKAGFALMEWYASHPRAQARFIVERRNGLSNPKAFDYIPPEIAANVSTAPKNAAQSVGVDFGWVVKHRDAVYRRWQEWLTK